jgi:purine-binding chemotaxis protein CheW
LKAPRTRVRDVAREVLVFLLDEEEYGIDILTVQEIRGYENVTAVPGVPAHVKGVMDLRGVIVPIVDLRVRFGRAAPSYDALTVVIVLELAGRVVGMVVDGVSDVVQLQAHEIKPAPELGSMLGGSFLREVAVKDGRMLLLADIAKLVAADELDLLDAA